MRKQGMVVVGGVILALAGLVSVGLAGAPQIENFNLPDGSLPAGWVVISDHWKVVDRQLEGSAVGAAGPGPSGPAHIEKTDVNFSNGTIMFKFRFLGVAVQNLRVSHMFRVQDNQNRYGLSWDPQGLFQLNKTVNGQSVSLGSPVTVSPFSDWQAVKIDASDTRIRVLVNDVLVFDVADNRTSQGRIAFFIPNGEEGTSVLRYDHVSIKPD